MNPDLFPILNSSTPVKLLMGANPLRVWPWGQAPDKPKKPYAVYGVYNATTENYLAGRADMDDKGTQIDIYGDSAESVEDCFNAIRTSLESIPYGYLDNWSALVLEEETELFHVRMEYSFKDAR